MARWSRIVPIPIGRRTATGTNISRCLTPQLVRPVSLPRWAILALWDHNFYSGEVGGEQLLADMQRKGLLNDGKLIDYASGLSIDHYRGLETVGHAGGDAGY